MSNAVLNGLAGAGGGIISQIITYPLQTVILSLFYLLHLLQCFVLSRNCQYLSKLDEKKLNLGCRLILGSRLRGLLRLRVKQINPLLLLIEALVAVPWFNSYRFHLLPPLIWPRHIYIHVGKCSGCVTYCSSFKLKDWVGFTAASSPLFLVPLLHRFACSSSYFDLLQHLIVNIGKLHQLGSFLEQVVIDLWLDVMFRVCIITFTNCSRTRLRQEQLPAKKKAVVMVLLGCFLGLLLLQLLGDPLFLSSFLPSPLPCQGLHIIAPLVNFS